MPASQTPWWRDAVFTDVVRGLLTARPELVDSRKYLGPAREAVAAEVTRLLGVLRSAPVD